MVISHPTLSPINGIDVFKRYAHADPDHKGIKICSFMGTCDILHPASEELEARLKLLGEDAVESELVVVSFLKTDDFHGV